MSAALNTAIFSRSGGYMGIGFAIPVNMAKDVVRSLIAHGRVIRGRLGVSMLDVTPELPRSVGYRGTEGAVIADVVSGSPAARAGLRQGDVVVRYEGRTIASADQLQELVAATPPGRTVRLEIVRNGRRMTSTARLTEQRSERVSGALPGPAEQAPGLGW